MPGKLSTNSIESFFKNEGMRSPLPKIGGSQMPHAFTVWKDPRTGEEKLTFLDQIAKVYRDSQFAPEGYTPETTEQKEARREAGKKAGIEAEVLLMELGRFKGETHGDKMAFFVSNLLEEGKLFVYRPGEVVPVAIKAQPLTAEQKNSKFPVDGTFAYDERTFTEHLAKEPPKMSLGRRFLSIFGAYKEERAAYDKDMAEYKSSKVLVAGFEKMIPERRASLAIENVQRKEREEGKIDAQRAMKAYAEKTEDLSLDEEMNKYMPVFNGSDGWPNREDRKVEFERHLGPDYEKTIEAVKEIQRENTELLNKLRLQQTTEETQKGAPALCDPEAYLELRVNIQSDPKDTAKGYETYIHAMSNMYFNDSPSTRQKDMAYLHDVCKDAVMGMEKSMRGAGYTKEYIDRSDFNGKSTATNEFMYASVDRDVMGKLVGDTRACSAYTMSLLKDITTASGVDKPTPALMGMAKTTSLCIENVDFALKNLEKSKSEPCDLQYADRQSAYKVDLNKYTSLESKMSMCHTLDAAKQMVAAQLVKPLNLSPGDADKSASALIQSEKTSGIVANAAQNILELNKNNSNIKAPIQAILHEASTNVQAIKQNEIKPNEIKPLEKNDEQKTQPKVQQKKEKSSATM